MIDDRVFGDVDSFRAQFTSQPKEQAFANLRLRIAPICKRTLQSEASGSSGRGAGRQTRSLACTNTFAYSAS